MNSPVLKREATGPLSTNCYLLYDVESKEAALFDIGGPIDTLMSIIEHENLKMKYIFCTHLHFDHVLGVGAIRELFPEALLAYNQKETAIMENLGFFAKMFEFDSKSLGKHDISIEDDQIFSLGNLEIRTILSPGHSPGSICFSFEHSLISGDVLFNDGIGRTDLFGGSFEELEKSILKLYKFSDKTLVFPGHGDETTIGKEKRNNPFVSFK